MKAGDEVPAGDCAYEEYIENRKSLTERQIDWLVKKQKSKLETFLGTFRKCGVPSDAELQRKEIPNPPAWDRHIKRKGTIN